MAATTSRETPSQQRAWRSFEPAFDIADRQRNDGSGSFLILKVGSRDITPKRVLAEHNEKPWGVKWTNVKVGNGFFPVTLAFDSVEQIQAMASALFTFASEWEQSVDVEEEEPEPVIDDDNVAAQIAANERQIALMQAKLAALTAQTSSVVPVQPVPARRTVSTTRGAAGKNAVQASLARIPAK